VQATGQGVGSLDGVWSYVLNDDNLKRMSFAKPGRVVAYELTASSWDGSGVPPATAVPGAEKPRVGDDLKTFAQRREASKTSDWLMTKVWIAFAPFKMQEIVGLERIPWP